MKKNPFRLYLIAVFSILIGVGIGLYMQSGKPRLVRQQFLMLGTIVDIQIVCPKQREPQAHEAIELAREEIAHLENLMSPYKPESDISRINAAAGLEPVGVSEETFRTVSRALSFSELTGGAFDITFSPVGKLWKLNPENPYIPNENEIAEKLKLVNYKDVILNEQDRTIQLAKKGMEIGLGGIAKGTAVDCAIKVIRENGFSNALVNAGGDLFALGKNRKNKPWLIGIRHPRDNNEFLLKIEVSNRAVVTSGDYERMVIVDGKRYHHILDPKTGYPAKKCISVTVVAKDAETADALSTAFFVLGAERGIELAKQMPGVDVLFVNPKGKIHATEFFNIPK